MTSREKTEKTRSTSTTESRASTSASIRSFKKVGERQEGGRVVTMKMGYFPVSLSVQARTNSIVGCGLYVVHTIQYCLSGVGCRDCSLCRVFSRWGRMTLEFGGLTASWRVTSSGSALAESYISARVKELSVREGMSKIQKEERREVGMYKK